MSVITQPPSSHRFIVSTKINIKNFREMKPHNRGNTATEKKMMNIFIFITEEASNILNMSSFG